MNFKLKLGQLLRNKTCIYCNMISS